MSVGLRLVPEDEWKEVRDNVLFITKMLKKKEEESSGVKEIMYTQAEAMRLLNVKSPKTMSNLTDSGRLAVSMVGRKRFYKESDLQKLFERGYVKSFKD